MSEMTSSRFSRSTTNNSKYKKNSITSSQIKLIENESIEKNEPKDEYEDYIITKKEKSLNMNKIEILKNRINNLKQQEQKNIRQIEILQEKEEKMKKIINAKKENKKMIDNYKKKEQDKFNLIRKKIQEDRLIQINNLNNSLLKRREDLNKKKQVLKKNKNEIKNKINRNNNNILNTNKQKYEKAKTSMIFNKDKNMILKAEKEEEKRNQRIQVINKEKMQNISLEKNIEILEQEEEKYLELIRQTKLLKQNLNNNAFNTNNINRSFINRNINNNELEKINNITNKKFIRLETDENYKNKVLKINKNSHLKTVHNSIDLNSIDNYFNKRQKLLINENKTNKSLNKKIINNFDSKSCTNRNNTENLSFDKIHKDKIYYNNIYQRAKKFGLKQKIIDKIVSIKLKTNLVEQNM